MMRRLGQGQGWSEVAEQEFVTVVSGLPRSGTSMMMRMLEAGGQPVVADHERAADADNPGGYYEFEPVKGLDRDATWVEAARGRVVKVIYKLVYELPAHVPCRIVFLERDLNEVLASQEKMLMRMGRKADGAPRDELMAFFRADLAAFRKWASDQPHLRTLYLPYAEVVADPRASGRKIADFLDRPLDVEAMGRVVDPSLYRQRAGEP